MRWFVEITPIGSGATAEKLCVEAAHWQPALQAARKLRGESDQLSGLSVEFLDDGCRAFDPALRLRYVVSKAPDDAALDEPDEKPAEAASGGAEPSSPEQTAEGSSARASTMDAGKGAAEGDGAPQRASTGRRPRPKTMAIASRGEVVQAVEAAAGRSEGEAAVVEPGAKRPRPKTMAMASRGEVVAAVDAVAERTETDGEQAAPPVTERVPEADGDEPSTSDAPSAADAPETDVEPEPPPMTQPSSSLDEPTEVDDNPPQTVDYAERSGGDGATAVEAQEQLLEATLPSAEVKLGFHLLSSRDVQPTDESPLVYREFVYGVDAPVSLSKAEQFIRERFAVAREQLEDVAPGKVVNVALFDHVFTDRPQRPPMVTLTWKDWRGAEPEIVFFPYGGAPARRSIPVEGPAEADAAPAEIPAAPAAPRSSDASRRRRSRRQISSRREPAESTPTPVPAPAPEASPATSAASPHPSAPPAAQPTHSEPPAAQPTHSEPPAAQPTHSEPPAAQPTHSEPPAARQAHSEPPAARQAHSEPPAALPTHSEPPAPYTPLPPSADPLDRARALTPRPSAPGGPRLAGDDLLADLFEAMAELHFINELYEGADFVLALALEKLPSEIGMVSLFDINRRQYVVVRQVGGARSGLLARLSQRAKLPMQAMRFARAVVVEDTLQTMELVDERWEQLGVVPRSLICAPVELGGRYLGLIELANPRDGQAFQESDGHALTYIGQQFAEFVAERGVVLDPEVVLEGVEPDVQ